VARKILIIDDEPDFVKVMVTRLTTHGFDVISASDGETGFEKARKYLPDIILLDVKMPGWSGIETANRLKDNHGTALIPVIFLTGMGLESITTSYLKKNNFHVLAKPFRAEDLLAILTNDFGM
jgi:DNA-binding response OmpR family regulator